MRIATFNVNGITSRLPALLQWLDETQPDVACLQELKAPQEKFPEAAINEAGYEAIWHGQKSWNGVAILARGTAPVEVGRGLPGDPEDEQSRYIEAAVEWRADRLPVPAERQSGARPEVRLQAEVVRAADPARRRAARRRLAGGAGGRLQRHADRARRLQARALGQRCAVPPGDARGVPPAGGAGLDAMRCARCIRTSASIRSGTTSAMPTGAMPACASTICCSARRWRRRLKAADVDRDVRGREKPSDHAPTWIELDLEGMHAAAAA